MHVVFVPTVGLGKGLGKFCSNSVVRGTSSSSTKKLIALSAATVSGPSAATTRQRYAVLVLRSLSGVKLVAERLLSAATTTSSVVRKISTRY